MRLAHSRRAEQDDVLAAVEEAQLVQALELLALDGRLEVKSNCASVLTAGRREERIAACSRRLLRSAIWALSTSSIASPAVDRFEGAGPLQVRQHRPQPVAPVTRRRRHPAASA